MVDIAYKALPKGPPEEYMSAFNNQELNSSLYKSLNEDEDSNNITVSVNINTVGINHDKEHTSTYTNNTPSTPTSTSFKVSRSDASDLTNDTLPSSIEERNNIQQPINNSTSSTIPLNESINENATPTNTIKSFKKKLINEIDPLNTNINDDITIKEEGTKNNVLNRLIDENESKISSRRHTSPHNQSCDLTKNDHSFKPPISRSTFPSYNNQPKLSSHDSTNSEILRMRNSILVKRNIKKKRKEFLEDEKVLVGNKISEGHENFVMAYNMLTGIRVAVSRCSGIMKKLNDEDFKSTKKLSFNMDGSELTPSSKYDFKFKDYCPEVFRELRNMFGLDPADYLVSITGKYILSELGSPGKSGSFFYYSRDYRFIIKTIHHSEHKQLRRILKDYYNHVKENPNTLISQFYGLHRVKMPFLTGSKKIHFIVMNNLFPPHRDIHLKYDLKGSTWGRTTKINSNKEDLSSLTLKDLNFLERNDSIKFGPNKKSLFFKQLESDVKLLKKINVMDYSLLLGIHDVKKGNNSNFEKLSVFDPKSSDKFELIKTNPRDIDRENDLPTNVYPGRSKYVFYGHDGGIRSTNELNEPLNEIYYLGIIDCLTNYSTKKKLETFWRSLGHQRSTISALPANEYGDRFLKFIKDGTSKIKQKIN